jgi:hypothetical protein
VDALAGVVLEMGSRDADAFPGAVRPHYVDMAVLGDGLVVLRNLVALRQVRIEVVLAREDGRLAHLAIQRQPRLHRHFHDAAIQHRQRAGHAEANRTDVGIGLGTETGGATTENLGLGGELDVHLKADHGLVLGHLLILAA